MRKQSVGFGPFEFDTGRSLLFRSGSPVPLGRRGAALLGALLARRGEVLNKSELMDAVWPGVIVEEANLSVQVSLLRQVIGSTPGGGEWILTIPRIGYRFVPAAEPRVAPPSVPSLAVLPFTDLGTGALPEANGFAEDLTTALSKFRSISLLARTVADQGEGREPGLRRLAKRLGAGYVLEGSLRRVGNRHRIGVQLIDGATGSFLWAEHFDHAAGNLEAADETAARVAALVECQIQNAEIARSLSERSQSASAYDLYLRARRLVQSYSERDNFAAHALLQRALALEPENIHILALACEVLHHRVAVGWRPIGPADRRDALDLARRGVALGIDDGAALGLFSHAMFTAGEWDLGRITMERAVAANPSSMALSCAGQGALFLGDTDGAEAYYQRAFALGPSDPNRHFTLNGLAVVARRRGDYDTAIQLARNAIALKPGFSGSHWQAITASAYAGYRDAARRHVARYRAISPHATIATIGHGQPILDERLLNHLLEGLAEAGMPEA